MSVIVEFSIDGERFSLGRALRSETEMRIELERIVPTKSTILPFFWASNGDFELFEETVRDTEEVVELKALDRIDGETLYRIEWRQQENDLVGALADTDAVVLEGVGDEQWHFRVRFSNHADVSRFYNRCTEGDLDIHIDRTYSLTSRESQGLELGLTPEQREALVLALRRGYFETPKHTSLTTLAEELGISQQALSSRIRRGSQNVFEAVLMASASDFD